MCTHVLGFQSFFTFFASFCIVKLATRSVIIELTLMLLLTNLANIKWCKKPEKWLETLANGVLIWEYSVRAIQWVPAWQGLDVFQKSLHLRALDESSLRSVRVKWASWSCQVGWLVELHYRKLWEHQVSGRGPGMNYGNDNEGVTHTPPCSPFTLRGTLESIVCYSMTYTFENNLKNKVKIQLIFEGELLFSFLLTFLLQMFFSENASVS